MKAGKKYSKNGVQYAMYPNQVMNITQTINGSFSHMGTNAIDDAQQDTGASHVYAPCDMVCTATGLNQSEGNVVFWTSQKPVQTVSHGKQYITLMIIHDNTANAYVGMKIKQGVQIADEGTAGFATGNHNHFEVKLGKFTHKYILNSYGVYMMPGNINPAEVFFVDDTKIINGGGLKWKKINDKATTKPVTKAPATSSKKPDQILYKGSTVTSETLSITGIKTIDGVGCVNIPSLGGWFPAKYVSEVDASDGKKDQIISNTKAKVKLDECKVEKIDSKKNLAMIHGIWVKPDKLIELKD